MDAQNRAALKRLLTKYARALHQQYAPIDADDQEIRERETSLLGHQCGHEFEVTIRSRLHSSGAGDDPTHSDADWWDEPTVTTVRAHDLPTALRRAAASYLEWAMIEGGDDASLAAGGRS